MHVVGAFLLILALSGFGFIRTLDLKQRPRELRMMIDAMALLRSDITSRMLPLPDALAHAGGACGGLARVLLISVTDRLISTSESFEEVWKSAVNQLSVLNKDDRAVLCRLGSHLGQFDAASQGSAIDACIISLKRNEVQACEYANQYSRLYTGLGLTLGAMLAVVLY